MLVRETFWQILLIVLALLSTPGVFARDIPIYNNDLGWTPQEMDLVIASAQPGDTLVFNSHYKFKVGRKLGCGGTTCIFELLDQPGKAIRIPWKTSKASDSPQIVTGFIDKYAIGYQTLLKHGVPTAQVFDYVSNLYVIVENLNISTTLYDFLRHSLELSEKKRELMTRQLLDFAKKSKDFARFGNFNSTQVGYVEKRGWILIDWTAAHQPRHSQIQNQNVFDVIFNGRERDLNIMMGDLESKQGQWIKETKTKIKNTIARERYGLRYFECQAAMLNVLMDSP